MTILCSLVIAPDLPRAVVTELIGFLPISIRRTRGSGIVVVKVEKARRRIETALDLGRSLPPSGKNYHPKKIAKY
jgi:hypothetical protein